MGDFEKTVRDAFPNAWVSKTGGKNGGPFYCVMVPMKKPVENLGEWVKSEEEAWKSAAMFIKDADHEALKVCSKCNKYFKPSESIHVALKEHELRFGVKAGIYHKHCCPLHKRTKKWRISQQQGKR